MLIKKISIGFVLFISAIISMQAQQYLDPEYIKVTQERSVKIVSGLHLDNTAKEEAVTHIIAKQYQNLTMLQDKRDGKVEVIKRNSNLSEEKQNKKIEKLKTKTDKAISKLHKSYLKQLASQLNETQIDVVKDGMTYGVLPKTYTAFLEMIPSLNQEQKDYIYNNLKEAREKAMDGGSSKEKHAWFGKYKGKINNYLSSQGYNLQKERNNWYKRIEEKKR
ncbi:MAG: DUF3826 domain-containing protein [Aestuariibaculum sp.]